MRPNKDTNDYFDRILVSARLIFVWNKCQNDFVVELAIVVAC